MFVYYQHVAKWVVENIDAIYSSFSSPLYFPLLQQKILTHSSLFYFKTLLLTSFETNLHQDKAMEHHTLMPISDAIYVELQTIYVNMITNM
jgi:hypothetical protein